MKFSLSWLKAHLDTQADAQTIAAKLTAIGLEVEGVANPADRLRDFTVARVVEAGPHPDADKLQLLSVDDGSGERRQVVCGAPNARAGMVGVFGAPGTYIPGSDFTLKPAKIRGVESFGMMCSARELELGDDHDGIIELAGADGAVGQSYADYAALDDPVLDVAITPNRQDCMGVRGIARDLAAAGMGTLRPLEQAYEGAALDIPGGGAGPDVRTDDPEGCPAFYARTVRGVTNGAAPDWMQRRLRSAGQKPISLLVDITNFVMLDLGRPLHVYDMAKLDGAQVARRAREGETVTALNGKEYTLDPSITVIADAGGAHDIGGIMGGAKTGAGDATTDVLVECAYFTPEHIARTGQKLNLTSDARQRFERGVDPAFLDEGLAVATWLITVHAGGVPSEVTRAGSPPTERRTIAYDPAQCAALGGLDVKPDRQQAILEALGFASARDGDRWAVTVPTWRRDVTGWQDLVEEVVRIVGLDAIPSTPLPRQPGVAQPTASPAQLIERRARRAAAGHGLNEVVTWSFIAPVQAEPFGGAAWTLANPISEDMKAMRPSLLPGLLAAAQRNMDRGAAGSRLFEVGRRYLGDAEHPTLGLVLAGEKSARHWRTGAAEPFDAYDAKAAALAVLQAAGAPVDKLMVFPPDGAQPGGHYHPGQSATLRLGPKKILAGFGTVHPAVCARVDCDGPVAAAELFLDAIPVARKSGAMRAAFAPPSLQSVTRDFAFLVDAETPADDLLRAVRGADKTLIVDARVFDIFAGKGVADGSKSVAIEVTLQPRDASLTDDDLKTLTDKVVAAAAKHGAELRG